MNAKAREDLGHAGGSFHLQKRCEFDGEFERLARTVVLAGLEVHRTLGPGLLESTYEHCLAHELQMQGISAKRQVVLPVRYAGIRIEAGYRIDILVEDAIVIEIESVDALTEIHRAQRLTYLKLLGDPIGFLMNFNVLLFK